MAALESDASTKNKNMLLKHGALLMPGQWKGNLKKHILKSRKQSYHKNLQYQNFYLPQKNMKHLSKKIHIVIKHSQRLLKVTYLQDLFAT